MHIPEVLGEAAPGIAAEEFSIALMAPPPVYGFLMLLQCLLGIRTLKCAVAKLTLSAVCAVEVSIELGPRRAALLLIGTPLALRCMMFIEMIFILSKVALLSAAIAATYWLMVCVFQVLFETIFGIKAAAILVFALQVVPRSILVLLTRSSAQKGSTTPKTLGVFFFFFFGFAFAFARTTRHCEPDFESDPRIRCGILDLFGREEVRAPWRGSEPFVDIAVEDDLR